MSILGDRIRVPTVDELEAMDPAARRQLIQWATPRIVEEFTPVVPHPPQQMFLWLKCLEAFYGGAGGGGKSIALLLAALQYVDVPGYNALILRRTYADLALPGALMDRARELLSDTAAHPVDGGRAWVFPSGARITFGYAQYYNEIYRYRSAELQMIAYDELTTFDEKTYRFMFARLRRPAVPCTSCKRPLRKQADGLWRHKIDSCTRPSPDPRSVARYPAARQDGMTVFDVPLRMRSASNPGGIGHGWTRDRFVNTITRDPLTVFVPAKLSDNPSLDRDTYVESLMHLDPVERARILDGDWSVTDAGKLFQRHWFGTVAEMPGPARARAVRYWDLAATEVKPGKDPDWTAGALVGLHEGVWYIGDMKRKQLSPHGVEQLMATTAAEDGRRTPIWIEQEPGASGKSSIDNYQRKVLVGYAVRGIPPSGSKTERARPVSSAAEVGNVKMVEGAWNRTFLDEAELFPTPGVHDDQVDAVSGGVTVLSSKQARLHRS